MAHRRSFILLALVALAFAVTQAAVGGLRVPLDLDEAVYLSQFSSSVPTIPYAAHRAPGQGLAAAPVVLLTSSVPVIRGYLIGLSAVLLVAAYLPWLKVTRAAPLAAALFASTWISLRFAGAALPNHLVALGAIAAAGLLVRDSRVALAMVFAGLALLRPTDAAYIGVPLLVAALLKRRRAAAAAICAGLAAGGLWWLIEAYARFGSPTTRLGAIASINGTDGLHFELLRYWAAMDGNETCLPTTADCGPITFASGLWWIGGAILVALGFHAARRAPMMSAVVICTVTAAVFAAAYLVLSDWAVPRYILPVFALLSIPASEGLRYLARWRPAVVLAAAAVLAHVTFQIATAARATDSATEALTPFVRAAEALPVTGRCAVIGRFGPQIAFQRRCHAADMHDGIEPRDSYGDVTRANIARLRAQGLRVIATTRPRLPEAASWRTVPVPGTRLTLYLSP
ncbi:hypothetical protein SMC26_29895 [Actinomadura fulvescens]|uniref:DUF2029 domain-containing protein n=1 Tax=Actinomadura fulvescens TaxID=46160 RepID=A0ABN3PBC4_9ACTN